LQGLYPLSLKMEIIYSSETPVDFNIFTWRHIPEDQIPENVLVRNSRHTYKDNIVACRDVTMQRPRDKRIYQSRF
jgi:hypothetical protein